MTRREEQNSRFPFPIKMPMMHVARDRPGLAVAAAGGLLLASVTAASATSVMLPPGASLPVPETTSGSEPDLDGIALHDSLLPFMIMAPDGAVVCAGKLQDRVMRSTKTGMLIFSYRIRETSGSGAVGGIAVSSFSGAKLSVAFRMDGQGTVAPRVVARNGSPGTMVTFELTDPPVSCAQHEESRFILIKTQSSAFRPGGDARILATTGATASVRTVEP